LTRETPGRIEISVSNGDTEKVGNVDKWVMLHAY